MRSVRQPGRSGVARNLRAALAAYGEQDYPSAFRQFLKIAEKGDCEAQYQVGLLYARGHGVVASLGDAVVWYRRAAEQSHAEAQYQLGIVRLHGGAPQGGADRWYDGASQIDKET